MYKKNVKLLEVASQKEVDASIVPISSKHIADVKTYWKYRLESSGEEDRHWDWNLKIRSRNSPNFEGYALEYQQITQGLIILEIDFHKSRIELSKSLIYIDYFATAPWNRPTIKNPPDYKGIGTTLFVFAISRSFDLEYKGRTGLHSLPKAEEFYRKFGLDDLGKDPNYQNLRYFELSSTSAQKFIS